MIRTGQILGELAEALGNSPQQRHVVGALRIVRKPGPAVRHAEQRDDVHHADLPDGFWRDVTEHLHVADVDAARDAWEDLPGGRRVAAQMPTSPLYEAVLARWRARADPPAACRWRSSAPPDRGADHFR